MYRILTVVFLAAITLAACAPTPRSNPLSRSMADGLAISSVEVTTTGAAFESALAADFTSKLDPDLTAAIQSEFAHRTGPNGAKLLVDVSVLNISDSRRSSFGYDQSKLIGQARLVTADGAVLATYPIQVTAGGAAKTRFGALVGTAVESSGGYYATMVRDFAKNLRQQIEN